jgi:hypothetical protein
MDVVDSNDSLVLCLQIGSESVLGLGGQVLRDAIMVRKALAF